MHRSSLNLLLLLISLQLLNAQNESAKKITFSGDFRFRIEKDWNSRKSDGTYRDDRTRLRFRIRAGMNYRPINWARFGIGFRTGFREKQQDPQLTLGDGYQEFNSVPLSFDKLFFSVKHEWLEAWIGRNSFPFERQNELFWSDNVSPDGVYLSALFETKPDWIESVKFSSGLFTMFNSYGTFDNDSFIGVLQVTTSHWNGRLKVFPTFYHFNSMPDIPDGNESYRFAYSILHLGSHLLAFEHPRIIVGLDLYQNIQNYQQNDAIPKDLRDQKKGIVTSILWGSLAKKGDIMLGAYYLYMERYAAVDFLAQNDWARWDYSNHGSRDGRLTNFKGLELMAGYRISKRFRLKMRYFTVDQIIPYGVAFENGNRIRLDLDITF